MSDNNLESSSEYAPSAESSEDEVDSTQEEALDTDFDKEFDYTNLAAFLINNNNDTFNFSMEEDSIIKGSCVNTVRYKKSKVGVENRFFDTIEQFGGKEMKPLLEFIEVKQIKERRFYVILRGRRNEHKRIILSKCLLLYALKWRNQPRRTLASNYSRIHELLCYALYFLLSSPKESYSSIRETSIMMVSYMLSSRNNGKMKLKLMKHLEQVYVPLIPT